MAHLGRTALITSVNRHALLCPAHAAGDGRQLDGGLCTRGRAAKGPHHGVGVVLSWRTMATVAVTMAVAIGVIHRIDTGGAGAAACQGLRGRGS